MAFDKRDIIVEAAIRLFRQLGFQKTTVADIARELRMSPANVYRFFGAKSQINEAVCMELLGKIEAEAGKIVVSRGTALQRMRNLVASVEKAHYKQYMLDRKLHELIEAAVTEDWATMRAHNHRMNLMLEQIIASGMAAGEFHPGDAALAARLVNTACIRFCHPRLRRRKDPPEEAESIVQPRGGPPLKSGSVGAALPLPEQDRFLSLGQMSTTKIKRETAGRGNAA
ncbi:MAG: TetR family transcriptional regulator [Beijerinckiaceae bacterium]|nr:MAG: TetR family transcriptional regulator [Beijerinckiaceae bacterium]